MYRLTDDNRRRLEILKAFATFGEGYLTYWDLVNRSIEEFYVSAYVSYSVQRVQDRLQGEDGGAPSAGVPRIPGPDSNTMTSGEEKMPIPRDIRRRFHRYRFEDLPPETREAVIQVRGYEESRADPDNPEDDGLGHHPDHPFSVSFYVGG